MKERMFISSRINSENMSIVFLYDEDNDIIDIGEVLCDSDDWEEYIG